MSKIKLQQFGGQLPAWDDTLLPDGQAASALNCYLFSGVLTGWREPKLLRTLTNSAAAMVYRIPVVTSSVARAVLVFTANPAPGDTIKVGEEVYTFVASVVEPYDILIGANATVTCAHVLQAFTQGDTAGTTYGLGTVSNPVLSQDDGGIVQGVHDFGSGDVPILTVKAPEAGTPENATIVTESSTALTWIYIDTTAGYDVLSITNTTTTLLGGTNPTFDNEIDGDATWLEFVDPDTDVMRSPVVNDKYNRYYKASPSEPPKYNTYDRIIAGQPFLTLGVPAPGCDPGVTVLGGGDLAQLGFPNAVTTTTVSDIVQKNRLFLVPVTPLGDMSLNEVAFSALSDAPEAFFTAVVYTDLNGEPDEIVDVGVEVYGAISGETVACSFLNPPLLSVNTPYWIGFMTDTEILVQVATEGTTFGRRGTVAYSNGAPVIAPTTTGNHPTWQMWANLTTTALLNTRAYVYTWVTEYGEEGPPSPSTLVNGWSNGVWTISLFTPAADEMGVTRNITKSRIYRTVPATNGATTFFLVAELDIGTETYVDTTVESVVATNTILPSTYWFEPPAGLEGITSMPNGITVGFKNNELWFSEPYRPHAWNPNYVLTTEFPIVGIGVTGQTVVACTGVSPYAASGVSPGSMSLNKATSMEPCISRGSIVSTNAAVFYSSPNGLIAVSQAGVSNNTTEGWITRERWKEFTPAKNLRAILLSTDYLAFGTVNGTDTSVAQEGFTVELRSDSASFTIWPQPGGHRIGFGQMSAPQSHDIKNVLVDHWTGIGMLIQNGGIYYYDFSDDEPDIQPYTWKSKRYQEKERKNYEALKVYFDIPPGSPTQSATRVTAATDSAVWDTLGANQYGIIRVFADDRLITTREIRTSGEMLRIISGFKADFWQFEITARVRINNVQVATSVKELSSV